MCTLAQPPAINCETIELPLTRLHYARCGTGSPLIIVPATISSLENWESLIQFMGQRFTAHFFELPGHGGSSAFVQPFSSELVSQTVEDFADALGFSKFSLMGFSFGGILTLRILKRLQARVGQLILLSPCVAHTTLRFSRSRLAALRALNRLLMHKYAQGAILDLLHNPLLVNGMLQFIRVVGRVELHDISLRGKLLSLPSSTLDVLVRQINEILNTQPIEELATIDIPCTFGMSSLDPLLSFETTLELIRSKFYNLSVSAFNLPYHQPPRPFTFAELNREFGTLLQQLPVTRDEPASF